MTSEIAAPAVGAADGGGGLLPDGGEVPQTSPRTPGGGLRLPGVATARVRASGNQPGDQPPGN